MSKLILKIVTPSGNRDPIRCDSVHLTICDDLNGKGGGSYGIRAGHAKSLLSLDKGVIKAFLSGQNLLTGKNDIGFATVEQDAVTVVTDAFVEMHNEAERENPRAQK